MLASFIFTAPGQSPAILTCFCSCGVYGLVSSQSSYVTSRQKETEPQIRWAFLAKTPFKNKILPCRDPIIMKLTTRWLTSIESLYNPRVSTRNTRSPHILILIYSFKFIYSYIPKRSREIKMDRILM